VWAEQVALYSRHYFPLIFGNQKGITAGWVPETVAGLPAVSN
jgi:hypothetical protein